MNTLLFNKPYRVLSQFTDREQRPTLGTYINKPNFYPAGRLDFDSEGLMLLTNNGRLQAQISNPLFKLEKSYWVQVEGTPDDSALAQLRKGVILKDGMTRPAQVKQLQAKPPCWEREPAVIAHRDANSSWLEITITEGKNRQVRRMLAAVSHPVLRLIRHRIGSWSVDGIEPGDYRAIQINLAKPPTSRRRKN